jgi:phage terminase large subunit GpA-like protein
VILVAQLNRSLRDVFAPIDTRQVWQWAEDEIVLSRRQTETPGPYSTLLTPYVREPLECFSDPRVTDLTLCFGSQTSKTTILMIGAAWRMVNNPAPTIWVMPTEHLCRSFSENRWQPMVDDCHKLAALKPANHNRWKALEMSFRDATLTMVGSNSPASLASRPAGLLIMDETDKFALPTSREAGAVALAENRTKSYTNALRVKASTPTTGEGEIWQAFTAADQRFYFVPCPHCGHKQRLIWGRVRWADDAKEADGKWNLEAVKRTAHYVCESCEGQINSGHKTKMLREGEWRATNPNAPAGKRSYHLNSLYAPWRSCGFGELAAQFLASKSGLIGLQDFINGALAEPWEEQLSEDERPIALGEYRLREPVTEGEVRMMAVDVQMDHYWFVCRAFKMDGTSRLVDEGRLQLWEDVEAKVAELEIPAKRVGPVQARLVAVDYGYRAEEVYDRCITNRWIPAKGEERAYYPIKLGAVTRRAASMVRPYRKGWVHMLWSSQACQDILDWLRSGRGPEWTVAGDASSDYLRHMQSHRRIMRRNAMTGRETAQWRQIGKRPDHLWDCESMLCALAEFGGVFKAPAPAGVEEVTTPDL